MADKSMSDVLYEMEQRNEAEREAELKRQLSASQDQNAQLISQINQEIDPLKSAQKLTGFTREEIGQKSKSASDMFAENLYRSGVDSQVAGYKANQALRQQNIKQGLSGAGSVQEKAELQRRSIFDTQIAEQNQKKAALKDYASNIGGLMRTSTGYELGLKNVGIAQTPTPAPSYSSGISVICTELHKQGYMDDLTYQRDQMWGSMIIALKPHVYIGYRFLADPVVKLMKKSQLFTKIISIPALKWAEWMAYGSSNTGKAINVIGEPICGLIGKVVLWTNSKILIRKKA